jgi:hypothetical protein
MGLIVKLYFQEAHSEHVRGQSKVLFFQDAHLQHYVRMTIVVFQFYKLVRFWDSGLRHRQVEKMIRTRESKSRAHGHETGTYVNS